MDKLNRIISKHILFLDNDDAVNSLAYDIKSNFELIDKESVEGLHKSVIDYFNVVKWKYSPSKRQIKLNKLRKRLITSRVKEGAVIQDFKDVIDSQFKKWWGTEWQMYLTPDTLFSGKFDKYLDQVRESEAIAKGISPKVAKALLNPTKLPHLGLSPVEYEEYLKLYKSK